MKIFMKFIGFAIMFFGFLISYLYLGNKTELEINYILLILPILLSSVPSVYTLYLSFAEKRIYLSILYTIISYLLIVGIVFSLFFYYAMISYRV